MPDEFSKKPLHLLGLHLSFNFNKVDKTLERGNKDGVPFKNKHPRFGKGDYKHTPAGKRTKEQRRWVRPKPLPRKRKYTHNKRKECKCNGWGSVHQWMPILEPDFSNFFDFNFNHYSHYLDAVLNKIDPFPDDKYNQTGYTSVQDYLFIPTRMYLLGEGDAAVIFDSGCSVAVSLCKEYVEGTLTHVSKTMMGVGDPAEVEGESTV